MSDVYVYIYDISNGLARSMSQALLGRQIEGVWHTGIVVFSEEWFFGSGGISNCPPCGTILGQPQEKKFQGRTQVTRETFMSHVRNLSQTTFKGSDYHLLNHNCNNFSDELSLFLTGRKIPEHITGLPREVLSTPFGQMLMPMLEQMSVNPGTNSSTGWQTPANQNGNHSTNFRRSTDSVTSSLPTSAATHIVSPNPSSTTVAKGKFVSISAATLAAASSTLRKENTDEEREPLIDEIVEFCQVPVTTPIDWSLSRPHLYLLADLATTSGTSSSAACDLLALIFLREEMIAMTIRDPKKTLHSLASSSAKNDDLIRVLANITHHQTQQKWLLNAKEPASKYSDLTLFACLTKQLEKIIDGLDDARSEHVAILFYNACLGLQDLAKSGTDADFVSGAGLELVTPILEFLVRLGDRTDLQSLVSCLETFLEALDILVGINEDVRDLSKCYGIETDKIGTSSNKTKLLAAKIFG